MMKNRNNTGRHRLLGFLSVLAVCNCLQLSVMSVQASQNSRTESVQEETVTIDVTVSSDALSDSQELLAGYVEKVFYEKRNGEVFVYGNVGENRLPGDSNKKAYAILKKRITAVAEGTENSTEFLFSQNELEKLSLRWSAQELGQTAITGTNVSQAVAAKLESVLDYRSILRYLLMDCPYELYWFDKTQGLSFTYRLGYNTGSAWITELYFSFAVAGEYQGNGQYSTDSAKIPHVSAAAANAERIVKENENKTDYEKLTAYREKICELTSYNDEAAKTDIAYGNPWQLIWVFDGDPNTEVVCEGYSKAFQYLCDLSEFDDVVCYTVTGKTRSGPHMWNVVRLDEKNYLTDITNCDTGTIGASDQLFLAGARGTVETSYTVTCRDGDITYWYDDNQKTLFGRETLVLSDMGYEAKVPVIVQMFQMEVIYGDPVDPGHIKGTAKTADGRQVQGTFSWVSDVVSYGSAGTKTLKAVFRPDDRDTYSEKKVNVNVVVRKRPVTVQARAVSKVFGDADPVLLYDIIEGSLVPGDMLRGTLEREKGESVQAGGYRIGLGSLTSSNNPDYAIEFKPAFLTVIPFKLTGLTAEVRGTYLYTGSAITPTVQVKNSGITLAESDYRMEVWNNTDVGMAVIRISPKPDSNYTFDVLESSFKIELTGAEKGEILKSGKTSYEVTQNTKGVRTVSYAKADSSKSTVKIPDTVKVDGVTYKVTSVEKKAFKNNKKLKTVTIGSNVTSIGAEAFSGCTKLTTVKGCDKVQTIGDKAFYGCGKLKQIGAKSSTVTFSRVKTIGKSAFYNCKAIKKVNLTSTVLTKIGNSAFSGCTSMTSFSAKSTKLAAIGSKAFYKDKKLASITWKTSKLTKSNVGSGAFKGIRSTCKIKVPSKKVKSYKSIFKAKGAGGGVKVMK